MPAYKINKTTGNPDTLIAGGTLYADLAIGDIVSSGRAADNPAPGFFYCDGRALSRTTYADLFNAIGTSFGSGDGSTTFNIPDMRGEFMRGAGSNSHANQGNGGTVGQHQDATVITKIAYTPDTFYVNAPSSGQPQLPRNADNVIYETGNRIYKDLGAQTGSLSTNDIGFSTRPTNTSVNFFIKYKQVAVPTDFMSKVDEVYGPLIPSNASASNKLVTASDNNFKFTVLPSPTDFNTVKTPGVYSFGVSEKDPYHAPIVGTFTLIVSCQNADWVQQLAIFNGDGKTFVRISSSGNWSDWEQLATQNDLSVIGTRYESDDVIVTETSWASKTFTFTNLPKGRYLQAMRMEVSGTYADYCNCLDLGMQQFVHTGYGSVVLWMSPWALTQATTENRTITYNVCNSSSATVKYRMFLIRLS